MNSLYRNIIFCLLFLPSSVFAQSVQKMRKNEVKVAILSIASGTTKVTYERLIRDYQSVELTIGVIGLGFDKLKDSNPRGTAWRVAYKFITPTAKNANNQMCGAYCKPELCYSSYHYDHPVKGRIKVDYCAWMWDIGYDWVKNWFVFDIYAGLGYAFGNSNSSNYHHGFICVEPESSLALTAGFRVGVAF